MFSFAIINKYATFSQSVYSIIFIVWIFVFQIVIRKDAVFTETNMNKNTLVSILITCLVFANFFIYSRVITNSIPDAVYPDYVPENEQEISSSEQDDASDVEGVPYGYVYTTADIKDT